MHAQSALIFKLDQYLLWLIFSENAQMDMELSYTSRLNHRTRSLHPLTLLRRTSQVCDLWRTILLQSPSLWGQALDIEALLWSHENWRKLVISRTGHAFLHVKGCVRIDPEHEPWKSTGEIFMSLLNEFWPRIRRLCIEVMEVGIQSEEKALTRWRVLQRPAPNLEYFNIHFGLNSLSNLFVTEGHHLFSDDSPCLRYFLATNIHFQLCMPCFFHLKSLKLSSYFTVPQILDALSEMDSLESLTVNSLSIPDAFPLRHISLPRLDNIQISGTTGACMPLLDHITAAPGCRVYLEARSGERFSVREAEATHCVLARYAGNYLKTHIVSAVSINIHLSSFTFFTNSIATLNDPTSPDFKFKVDVPPESVSFLLSALIQCSFDSVKTFYISSRGHPASDPSFAKLFKLLTSIEEVELTPEGMAFLLATPRENAELPLFPRLRTIRVAPFVGLDGMDMVLPFLLLRRNLGMAIETFDLTMHPLAGFPMNFDFLEEVVGMKVIWKSGQEPKMYICGSGRPEELNFKYDPLQLMYDIIKL
ncbi:hypothetical protein BJ912DRAFT_986536 [Pholiota molesta]|nr:hypothetical protein BJ912DRAFT_986536 [Pholiota molesta]